MAKTEFGSGGNRAVFIDTSGFFALLSANDIAHEAAERRVRTFARARRQTVTTDYILDETFSLLKARGLRHLSPIFRNMVLNSRSLAVEWTGPEQFQATAELFLKQLDHDFSFTDCRSFLAMRERGLTDALSTDRHFEQAGFRALLAP